MTTNQDTWAEAFKTTLLAAVANLQVYVWDVDTDSPVFPYCVLYPIGITQIGGSMAGSAEDGFFNLQISTIGETTRQTETAADRIFQAIFAEGNGGYQYDFGSAWRQLFSLGAAEKSGDNTFRRDDTYQFRKEL